METLNEEVLNFYRKFENYRKIENFKKNGKNRLFSLPLEIVEKIFEYDNTNKENFDKYILCKKRKSEDEDYDRTEQVSFYRQVINNRRYKGIRQKYCEVISCATVSSWFLDGEELITPFPNELINFSSRFISKTNVMKKIYKINEKKHFIITCEMEMNEYIKELYEFLEEPSSGLDFEIKFYENWEDEYETMSFEPSDECDTESLYEFLKTKSSKKIMLMGDTIDEYSNLTLLAEKNKEGKDIVHIYVDMDVFRIEDDIVNETGQIHNNYMLEKVMREIFEYKVYQTIQIVQRYIAKNEIKKNEFKNVDFNYIG